MMEHKKKFKQIAQDIRQANVLLKNKHFQPDGSLLIDFKSNSLNIHSVVSKRLMLRVALHQGMIDDFYKVDGKMMIERYDRYKERMYENYTPGLRFASGWLKEEIRGLLIPILKFQFAELLLNFDNLERVEGLGMYTDLSVLNTQKIGWK